MIKRGFALLALFCGTMAAAQHVVPETQPLYSQYEFVPNQGQWHPLIRYKTEIPYGNLFLETDALHYRLTNSEDYNRIAEWQHAHPTQLSPERARQHSVRMRFIGMKYAPMLEAQNKLAHYYNYYIGSDQSKWASEVYPSAQVSYVNVYPDVNLEILGHNGLKYQWVVQTPNEDKVNSIKIAIEGASSVSIDNGQVIIKTTSGDIIDDQLLVYQQIGEAKVELNARYVLTDTVLSYEILGDINPNFPLIIDPELIFSTYSGSTADNFGYTATYDSRANLYAGGIVQVLPEFNQHYPVTSGSYDTSYNGGGGTNLAGLPCDVAISKYDSAGSSLLWATYLGGNQNEYPHSLVVDRNDDLVILGTTFSQDFPVDSLGYDTTISGGIDIYVTKLSGDGTQLLGSTYIGGSANDGINQSLPLRSMYADDFRGDVITDDDNNIFVATTTLSDDIVTEKAFQNAKKNGYDGLLFELSADLHTLNWATYLGGDGHDAFYSIKLDQKNNIYIGGGTSSTDLPATDTAIGPAHIGSTDGVLAIIDKTTKNLKTLTYWGTEEYDQIYFIDRDVDGKIYATGQTDGLLTKTPTVYGESDKGQFVFRIDTLLQNQDFVTTFGNTLGAPNLAPSAFLVDVCGHIYFSGWGSDIVPSDATLRPGSTKDMVVSDDAYQKTTDNEDFYIIVFGRDAETLLYATFFGGNVTGDHVDGGTSRFDKRGVMYQSVCSSCPPSADGQTREVSDFPTTAGAVFETNPSVRCSNASFKIDLQIRSAVIADFIANPTIGCGPLDVKFTSQSVLGDNFAWDFGDGTTSSDLNPSHIFTSPGTYTVTLTVVDSSTCNVSSMYQRDIIVLEQSNADFDVSFDGCDNKLTIENKSENGLSYRWDFGNGDSSVVESPEYDYTESGDYTIRLYVNEGTLCESKVAKPVSISANVVPEITLYNVFTPNNDGINDCFQFESKNLDCTNYELKIYSRWGEKVFESKNPGTCWNGGYKNNVNVLPAGTYYYLLKFGSKFSDPVSGIIELIK